MPLLVDKDNVGPTGMKAIQSMMVMDPTPDFQVAPSAASLPVMVSSARPALVFLTDAV